MGVPFISRQDISDYLGRDFTTNAGALMAVDSACQICRTFTELELNRGTVTEYYDGTGTDALILAQRPVNSIGTLSVSDTATPPTWTNAGTADYSVARNGMLYATNTAGTTTFGTVWPLGRQNIRVTYDYGYDSVPEDIRRVALEVAARTVRQNVAMFEANGEDNVRYVVESTGLMPTERAILRKYRR